MNNKEVGFTPDDNNNTRLPGSVQPEAQRGDSSYHHLDMAVPGKLDTADTAGVIGQPHIGGDYAMAGINKTASVTGPTGEVETTYNHDNLSAKFKYPNVHQTFNPLDSNTTTYSDHN